MARKSPAPQSTLSSPMSGGLQPSILSDEGLYVRMKCPMCSTAYLVRKTQYDWHRLKGTNTGLTCSRSCGRKRYHTLNPGASYFNRMLPEERGTPAGTARTPEQRAHLSRVLKALGHKPQVRGGNGTGMTPCEKQVSAVLPAGWEWNYPVALGKRQPGFPTNYKLDFAHPQTKAGLEVDGSSHTNATRRAQDRKKEQKLAQLGWSVFRISNAEVTSLSSTSKLKEYLTTLLATAS
jgi:hypothetical protein